MRRILITSLLLSPMLFTASAVASHPGTDDAAAPTHDLRISTGLIAPVLIYSPTIETLPNFVPAFNHANVVLSMRVDEQGRPNDIQVTKPVNPILDQRIVDAASKFRFQPAMLDQQAVPVNMNLTVEVEK